MKIHCLQCLNCGDIIFSRARHDFRECSCLSCAIDGGFDYIKISGEEKNVKFPVEIELDVTKEELYNDWKYEYDKYGLIKEEE